MIQVIPCALSSSMISRRFLLSSSLSEAVGSSRIRSSTFLAIALAISISCCLPTPSVLTGTLTSSFSRPTLASISVARCLVLVQSITPLHFSCSFPKNTFSATDRSGLNASSWWIITIPLPSLSLRLWKLHVSPLYTTSPSYVP